MKSLKINLEKFTGKTISKAQANLLKGGDDKRLGPSGGNGNGSSTPPSSNSNPMSLP